MRKLRLLPVVCLAFVFIFSSCVSKKKWTEMLNEKDQLDLMLSKTQDQVKSLEADVSTLGDEKDALTEEFGKEKTRMNEEIAFIKGELTETEKASKEMAAKIAERESEISRLTDAIKSPFKAFTEKGVQLQERGASLYVSNTIHFKSGSARLSDDSKAALQNIVSVLSSNQQLKMVVEGHTDLVPMKEGATYNSNEQLSKIRAMNVVKELVKMGIDQSRLTAVGLGSSRPGMAEDQEGVDQNEARDFNRRAEFSVITPAVDLYKLGETL